MTALTIQSVKGKMTRNLASCSTPRCGRSGTNRVSILGWPWDPHAGLYCTTCARKLLKTWEQSLESSNAVLQGGSADQNMQERNPAGVVGAPESAGRAA